MWVFWMDWFCPRDQPPYPGVTLVIQGMYLSITTHFRHPCALQCSSTGTRVPDGSRPHWRASRSSSWKAASRRSGKMTSDSEQVCYGGGSCPSVILTSPFVTSSASNCHSSMTTPLHTSLTAPGHSSHGPTPTILPSHTPSGLLTHPFMASFALPPSTLLCCCCSV